MFSLRPLVYGEAVGFLLYLVHSFSPARNVSVPTGIHWNEFYVLVVRLS